MSTQAESGVQEGRSELSDKVETDSTRAERAPVKPDARSNWDPPERFWISALVTCVAGGLVLVVLRGTIVVSLEYGFGLGLEYLPFMFGTFAAIIAGRAVYASIEGLDPDRFAVFCFKLSGLQLFLACCAQVANQLYKRDWVTSLFVLFVALLASASAYFLSAAKKRENPKAPLLDGLLFTLIILGIVAAFTSAGILWVSSL